MAVIMGQVAVSGTKQIFIIPPGAGNVTFYSTVATGQLYVGTSASLTASNGFAVSTVPVVFETYPSSQGTPVYGLNTASSSTLPVNYILSTGA